MLAVLVFPIQIVAILTRHSKLRTTRVYRLLDLVDVNIEVAAHVRFSFSLVDGYYFLFTGTIGAGGFGASSTTGAATISSTSIGTP